MLMLITVNSKTCEANLISCQRMFDLSAHLRFASSLQISVVQSKWDCLLWYSTCIDFGLASWSHDVLEVWWLHFKSCRMSRLCLLKWSKILIYNSPHKHFSYNLIEIANFQWSDLVYNLPKSNLFPFQLHVIRAIFTQVLRTILVTKHTRLGI